MQGPVGWCQARRTHQVGSHARRFFVNSGQQWSTVRTDGDACFHIIAVTACYVVGVIVAVRVLNLGRAYVHACCYGPGRQSFLWLHLACTDAVSLLLPCLQVATASAC